MNKSYNFVIKLLPISGKINNCILRKMKIVLKRRLTIVVDLNQGILHVDIYKMSTDPCLTNHILPLAAVYSFKIKTHLQTNLNEQFGYI